MTTIEFEIRVAGALPASVIEEMPGVRVVTHPPETVLRGPVVDQAQLIGIINRLQGLGVVLTGIRQLSDPAETSVRPPMGSEGAVWQ
jgi:hypothetical protein